MQCKCDTNAFRAFHIIANASKFNANASVFYANALLLQDIKEIIYILYIFHFITYIERREKSPFAPKIGINFKDLAFFSRIICTVRGFVVLLRCSTYLKGGGEPQTITVGGIFYAASEKHIGIAPRGNL